MQSLVVITVIYLDILKGNASLKTVVSDVGKQDFSEESRSVEEEEYADDEEQNEEQLQRGDTRLAKDRHQIILVV